MIETKSYIIKSASRDKRCPAGHGHLMVLINKKTKEKHYSCDACDAIYELGEIDD